MITVALQHGEWYAPSGESEKMFSKINMGNMSQ